MRGICCPDTGGHLSRVTGRYMGVILGITEKANGNYHLGFRVETCDY